MPSRPPYPAGGNDRSAASRPVRLAVVGGGVAGVAHARVAAAHPDLELVAVVERERPGRRGLAEIAELDLGLPRPAVFRELDELLASDGVDLVALCTPSGLHGGQAIRTIEAGRHVLVEKPVDIRLDRARLLSAAAAAAAERGLVASAVSQRRFNPSNIRILEAVRAGRLGRLTSAAVVVPWWRDPEYFAGSSWRGTWAGDGGGALMNQGIHFVDLLMFFLGEPDEVSGMTASLARPDVEVEDTAAAIIRFAGGALATVLVSTSARSGPGVRLQLHGTGGSVSVHAGRIEVDGAGDPAVLSDGRGQTGAAPGSNSTANGRSAAAIGAASRPRGDPAVPDDGPLFGDHLRQYDDIVAAIRDGRPPRVAIDDGVRALGLVTAVYVSNRLGRSVRFADVLDGVYDQLAFDPGTPMSNSEESL